MTDSKDDTQKMQIVFAPGAFDHFEGTQEELDEMIAEITSEMQKMMDDGTLLENSVPVDIADVEDMTDEEREAFERFMAETEDMTDEEFAEFVQKGMERKTRLN